MRLTTLIVVLLLASPCLAIDLTLMTFNIRYGTASDGDNSWDKRRGLVFDVLTERGPDVVGLQEALSFQLDEIERRFPEYAQVGVGRDDGALSGEFSSILYRDDRFHLAESGTFWLSETPGVVASKHWGNAITRVCTWARLIDRTSGEAFYVYNTHWDHQSQESREMAATLIRKKISERTHDDPVVIMGDFNAGETNPAIATLTAKDDSGVSFADTFRLIHPDAEQVGTFHGFQGDADGEKIDHIFVEQRDGLTVEVREAMIDRFNDDGKYPSDHTPVLARVKIGE